MTLKLQIELLGKLIHYAEAIDRLVHYDEKKGCFVLEGHVEIQHCSLGGLRSTLRQIKGEET